jgi:pimeloyl-ACP methyl ester carboxylesterase
MKRQKYNYFLSLILFFSILSVQLPAATAQTRRAAAAPAAAEQPPKQPGATCTGAWSGIVKYRRDYVNKIIAQSNDKNYSGAYSFERRTYRTQVTGQIILDGKNDSGAPQGFAMNMGGMMVGANTQNGRTSVKFVETADESEKGGYTDSCSVDDNRLKKCESTTTRDGQASGEGSREQFFLQFQGDKYGFSFRLPEASGTMKTVRKKSCTGYCNGDTNDNQAFDEFLRYDPEPVSVKNQTFDPKNPDRLQHAASFESRDGKTTTFVSWNLRRCAPPLQLIDLRFQEHRFPDPKEWVGMSPKTGTIDGNRVRVVARVLNTSTAARQATLTFGEELERLPNSQVAVSVAGGEVKDIEYIWDTRGFAWAAGGTPHSQRKITVKMNSESLTEEVLVKPKPVVLVGGYWTKTDAWQPYAEYLKKAHSEHWQAAPVGSIAMTSKAIVPTASAAENAKELEAHIHALRQRMNAWHVDMVAHSTGGLIARYYIHNSMQPVYDNRPEIAHLVMLGTPNNGTPCADIFSKNDMLLGKPGAAMNELRPSVMKEFNRRFFSRKNVRFSSLAGSISPITCTSLETGDGFVSLFSAGYGIADSYKVVRTHQGLTGEQDFLNFVKPRLDLSPQLAEQEEKEFIGAIFPTGENAAERDVFSRILTSWQASAAKKIFSNPAADESTDDVTTAGVTLNKGVKVPARQAAEIDVPVLTGARAVVVLMADAGVSATLLDTKGNVVGKSAGGAAEAEQVFRTIAVEKPAAGNLKLRLENSGAEESIVLVAAWTDTDPLQFTLSAGQANAAGQVPLTAKLTLNDAPVTSAAVKATIFNQKAEIVFFDDGKHSDGAAGDGIYGATTGSLGAGDYFVEARAETGGKTRAAFASFKIGK